MLELAFELLILFPALAGGADKAPLPNRAEVKEAEALVQDVFRKELAAAVSPAQKAQTADFLLQQGLETKNHPAGRYVLLRDAATLAAEVGEVDTACQAVAALEDSFEIDIWPVWVETISRLGQQSDRRLLSTSRCHNRFPPPVGRLPAILPTRLQIWW